MLNKCVMPCFFLLFLLNNLDLQVFLTILYVFFQVFHLTCFYYQLKLKQKTDLISDLKFLKIQEWKNLRNRKCKVLFIFVNFSCCFFFKIFQVRRQMKQQLIFSANGIVFCNCYYKVHDYSFLLFIFL